MLIQHTAGGGGQKNKKKQKTRKQRRRLENKKGTAQETDQDTIKTMAKGLALRTLELLFLLLIAIPMQSTKEIVKATKTSWHFLAIGRHYLTDLACKKSREISIQTIKIVTTASKKGWHTLIYWHYLATGWRYLTDLMHKGRHATGVPPGGAETAETGGRVKLKPKRGRKLQTKMGKTSGEKRKIKVRKTSWKFLKWGLRSMSMFTVFTTSTQRTQSSYSTHKRLYTLAHDKKIINHPGSAFPIKIATGTRNKGKIKASYKSWI